MSHASAMLLLASLLVGATACGETPRPVETYDPEPLEDALPDVVDALSRGDPEFALQLLDAHASRPDAPEGLDHFRGMALVDARRPAEAAAAFERELAARPGNGQAHLLLAEVRLAEGRLDACAEHLARAEQHGADGVYLLLMRGRLALARDDDESARRALRDFLEQDRYSTRAAEAHHALGQIAQRAGDAATAAMHRQTSDHLVQVAQFLNAYRERLERDPADAEAALGVGITYLNLYSTMGRDPEMARQAEAALRATLQRRPDSVKAHFNLGYLRSVENRFPEAIEHFEAALAIDPRHVGSLLNLGRMTWRRGETSLAEQYFATAVDAAADPVERAQVHVELGTLLESLGRIPEAVAHFESAVALHPGLPPEVGQRLEALRARADG